MITLTIDRKMPDGWDDTDDISITVIAAADARQAEPHSNFVFLVNNTKHEAQRVTPEKAKLTVFCAVFENLGTPSTNLSLDDFSKRSREMSRSRLYILLSESNDWFKQL